MYSFGSFLIILIKWEGKEKKGEEMIIIHHDVSQELCKEIYRINQGTKN
jgi:hypothetical protein